MRTPILTIVLLLASCSYDTNLIDNPRCDGVKQRGEDVVDGPFDRDGDGFVDGNIQDCQDTYTDDALDCDDGDETVNPGEAEVACDGLDNDCDPQTVDSADADEDGVLSCDDCDDDDPDRSPDLAEISCNALDDDCDPETPDAEDFDRDGVSACDDCNDGNVNVYPGNEEICDGLDNNCDDEVDEGCIDFSGQWFISPTPLYQCADLLGTGAYLVNVSLERLNVVHADTALTANAGNSQPGTMSGTINDDDVFSVSRTITGSCDETYTIDGVFIDEDSFEGTFYASYSGGLCLDCTNQSWEITGTR